MRFRTRRRVLKLETGMENMFQLRTGFNLSDPSGTFPPGLSVPFISAGMFSWQLHIGKPRRKSHSLERSFCTLELLSAFFVVTFRDTCVDLLFPTQKLSYVHKSLNSLIYKENQYHGYNTITITVHL